MKEGLIYFFEEPENEYSFGLAKFVIDCSTIFNPKIVPVEPNDDENIYMFSFDVTVFPRGEGDCSDKHYTIGVETQEELEKWVNEINNVLDIIRGNK